MKVRYDEGLDSEEIASYENKHDIAPKRFHPRRKYCEPDYDQQWGVSGYYNDNDGNDIRDRD